MNKNYSLNEKWICKKPGGAHPNLILRKGGGIDFHPSWNRLCLLHNVHFTLYTTSSTVHCKLYTYTEYNSMSTGESDMKGISGGKLFH